VKIDIEGSERLLLAGASKASRRDRIRELQVEWNECSHELLEEDRSSTASPLTSLGYRLRRPDPQGLLITVPTTDYGPDMIAILDRP
jgi:hypothetical protein